MEILNRGEKIVEADVADSVLKRTRGLMFRVIEEDEALLFPFSQHGKWSIWMPFVPQDLAVFWLDGEKVVVDKTVAERMTLNPATWKTYKPEEKCKYVLECRKDKINDIKIGDKLEWDRNGR